MQQSITSAGNSKLVFWIIGALGILASLAGIVAYIFLVYLPGTPENRYRTGFEAVGQGMDYLVEEGDIIEQISSTSYNGNLAIEFDDESVGDFTVNINVDGEYDTQNTSLNLETNGSFTDNSGTEPEIFKASGKVDLRFLGSTDSRAPRFYFKLSEFELPDQFDEEIDTYFEENDLEWQDVWWLLDFQELIDEGLLTDEDLRDLDLQNQLTQKDYEELTLIVINNLREYVFTSETDKMIFQMDELLGQEEFKGVQTHKYSVTVSEENLKDYITAMRDDFTNSSVWQKLSEGEDSETGEEEDSALISDEDIQELVEEFSENVQVEAWIDSESRVLRNLRFSDTDSKSSTHGSYFDFGIVLEESAISLETNIILYSDDDCGQSTGDPFEDLIDSDASKCPYIFEEADEETCGEQPDYDDYINEDETDNQSEDAYNEQYDEYNDALTEYHRCQTPVRSLKENAPVLGEITYKMLVDTEANSVGYEMEVDIGEIMKISLSLEFVGQTEVAEVEEPEDARSIFELFEEGYSALETNAENVQARADIAALRSWLYTYVANNNGNPPEGTQSAADMEALSDLYLGYYSLDDITYFDEDFDLNDPSGEFASESQSISYSEVHIWRGYGCQEHSVLASEVDYPSGLLSDETSRTLAFVYVLAESGNEQTISCEDNI